MFLLLSVCLLLNLNHYLCRLQTEDSFGSFGSLFEVLFFNTTYYIISEGFHSVGVQPGVPLHLCLPVHLRGALPLHLHHHGHLRDH